MKDGAPSLAWVDLPDATYPVQLEYSWIAPERRHAPLLVFLHEGLGSVDMWKDWPAQACAAADCRGLVYSRPGYGRSTPRPAGQAWPVGFMHTQARHVLPALFRALDVDARVDRPWLYGHSDGGSIALLYAALHPDAVAGVVAAAPHVFVEDITVRSIEQARQAYLQGDLRDRLGRYHADPDSAFWGWNEVWLNPDFRAWDIRAALPRIACPVLAIQGQDDEYGTLAQIDSIAADAPRGRALVLPGCGHSPHRDRPEAVMRAIADFIATAHGHGTGPQDTATGNRGGR
ncbi:alpha/beta fold hydrolase [Bordetella flabilis]|uniref:alpha/beta fold hydrolase n=1 Tax=Bordetella flabilis TaxID=463014 RepID=UPI000A02A833|nr:alpha/beta hydrolase [Bordetella flabilis]